MCKSHCSSHTHIISMKCFKMAISNAVMITAFKAILHTLWTNGTPKLFLNTDPTVITIVSLPFKIVFEI